MFIYSLRANTIKFFGILCVAMVALITLIAFVPSYDSGVAVSADGTVAKSISYDKIKTNEDRIKFLEQFGWQISSEAKESCEVLIPEEFDKVFAGYNEIQKSQGLDLSKYKKKKLTRYTYTVDNYEGYDGTVYANLLIYRNKVVGGDICSADADGFLQGFEK